MGDIFVISEPLCEIYDCLWEVYDDNDDGDDDHSYDDGGGDDVGDQGYHDYDDDEMLPLKIYGSHWEVYEL